MSMPDKPDYQGNIMESDGDVVLLVSRVRGEDPTVSLLRWPGPERSKAGPPLIWSGTIAELAVTLAALPVPPPRGPMGKRGRA